MSQPKIRARALDGDQVIDLSVDELIIELPNGISFSLFPGDQREDAEIIAFIKVPLTERSDDVARFILKPGATNQVSISAERLPTLLGPSPV